MKNCLENIGGNIRRLRKERSYTIEDLSEKCGLSAKYLQGVETAKNNISIVNLNNIATALEVDIGEIIETSSEAFKKSDDKLSPINARLKRYNSRQLNAVYDMLTIVDALVLEPTEKVLITPRSRMQL